MNLACIPADEHRNNPAWAEIRLVITAERKIFVFLSEKGPVMFMSTLKSSTLPAKTQTTADSNSFKATFSTANHKAVNAL